MAQGGEDPTTVKLEEQVPRALERRLLPFRSGDASHM